MVEELPDVDLRPALHGAGGGSSIQSMASETGFDLKIRVTEFATSLKQAESGEYQAGAGEAGGERERGSKVPDPVLRRRLQRCEVGERVAAAHVPPRATGGRRVTGSRK